VAVAAPADGANHGMDAGRKDQAKEGGEQLFHSISPVESVAMFHQKKLQGD
jgi:hypothetical protein